MSLYNVNSGYGGILANQVANAVGAVLGRILIVQEDSDPDEVKTITRETFQPDSEGRIKYFTDLVTAYGEAESNANDTILISAHSAHSLSTPIAWTKNRVHLIGMDGGDRLVQQGCRIQNASDDDTGYLIKNTGVRNSFRNIKFIQASADAASLNVFQMGGEGNLYKNCSFVFGVAGQLDETTSSEVLCGEDSGTFIDCTFGNDTLVTSAARSVFKIDQVTANQEFKSNIFVRPRFFISSSSSDAEFISMAAAGDILYTNVFEEAAFYASIDSAGGAAIDSAVSTANGTVKGTLYFDNPKTFGCTDFGTNGTHNDGLYVRSPLMVTTDLVGVQPVAT